MRIVVLAGGLSPERNVSLSSGVMVAEALRSRGHRTALVDLYFGLENWKGEPEGLYDAPAPASWRRVDHAAPDLEEVRARRRWKSGSQFGPGVLELCAGADAVFLALHGACGEDGRVQAALDLMGIPYTGSGHLGSAIAMDKDLTKRLCAQAGIDTPRWQVLRYGREDIPALSRSLEPPLVLKPMDSGSSIGVSIAHDRAELAAALTGGLAFGGRVIVEQYVSGREIQVGVLRTGPCPPSRSSPKRAFTTTRTSTSRGRRWRSAPRRWTPRWRSGWGRRPGRSTPWWACRSTPGAISSWTPRESPGSWRSTPSPA